MNIRKILIEVIIILVMSAVVGTLYNESRDKPLSYFLESKGDGTASDSAYVEQVTSADELQYYHSNGEAIILDARDRVFYDEGHIPFAISLPIREYETVYPTIQGIFSKSKTIIIYCNGLQCTDSKELADKLFAAGWRNIFIYKGGIIEWRDELQYRVEAEEK